MGIRILLIGAAWSLASLSAGAAELEITVSGLRGPDGQVKVMLFDRAEGFRKESHARAVLALPAAVGSATGAFADLPPGRYAIVAYHDEDGDGRLKLLFGMLPDEGYGLSNNPVISGPPAFSDAAFDLPENGAKLDIRLSY